MATGAEAGTRLLARLAMPTSADSLLRLIRKAPLPDEPEVRVLGVDDWAFRKGRTYGSILVDLEAHRVIELLPDRSSATLSAWLEQHPEVEVITRDRSTEYARAAAQSAPQAQQVADRWHLLLNARQMMERWLVSAHPRLRSLPLVSDPSTPSTRREASFPRTRYEAASSAESRARRLVVYDEVRRRYEAGQSLRGISRTMGITWTTARRYARAEGFPERAVRAPGPSILDPFLPYLSARHAEGCENALALWREIRARGFRGTSRQVHRWLQMRRAAPAPTTPRVHMKAVDRPRKTSAAPLPSPKQLAWICMRKSSELNAEQVAALLRIKQDAEASRVIALARDFRGLVRRRSVTHGAVPVKSSRAFDAWLRRARASRVPAVVTFAAGLEQDGSAVRSALTTAWSNAQTEGQTTRLKLLRRQMYGHGSFDLLRRRVLLTS